MSTTHMTTTTRRTGTRPVRCALALLSLGLAAVALTACVRDDRKGAGAPQPGDVRVVYRVIEAQTGDVDRVAKLLQRRLTDARVRARVTAAVAAGDDRIAIDAPPDQSTGPALDALTAPGRVAIYDWEARVIGPRGKPAPDDPNVTGGRSAGVAGSLTRYDAVRRAAALPRDRTTSKTYWLVDDKRRRVLAGPQNSRAHLPHRTRDSATRLVSVGAAIKIVQAQFPAADQWYVVEDSPALSAADIQAATSATDRKSKEGIVRVQFNARGQAAFAELTRTLAHRGRAAQRTASSKQTAHQHLAIVIDDKIVAIPYIDAQPAPDGLDAATPPLIQGRLSRDDAARLAAILNSGPLPAALDPSVPQIP